MLKILLLGVAGQVGHELARTLAPLGTLRTAGRTAGAPGVDLAIDLAQPEQVAATVAAEAPDWIVNAAAYTAVDRAEQETRLATTVNGDSVGVLAEAAARSGAGLVHFSTDYVFDGRGTRPYREDDPVDPVNAYGASKLAGEAAIRAAGCDHLLLRTAWVYGNHGRNFLRSMIGHATRRDELKVVDDQHGAPAWSRMLAELTALAIRDVAARGWNDRSGTYHLSARGKTTWCGFARRLLAGAHSAGWLERAPTITPITTEQFPTPAARPAYSVLDNTRFEEAFGVRVPAWTDQLTLCLQDFHRPHD